MAVSLGFGPWRLAAIGTRQTNGTPRTDLPA
jgi:hypothetical protein